MKKKEYKVRYENGQIKPLELIDLNSPEDGVVVFFEIENESLPKKSSGKSLLKHAGAWVGDAFNECLKEVHDARGNAEFYKISFRHKLL